jgi:hypothetical protein
MDLLSISTKTYLKIIGICLVIALLAGTTYYFTKGGFFDGILLTFVGLSLTYLIIILSILIFKTVTNVLAKDIIKVTHVIIAFLITVAFAAYTFVTLFNSIASEFKL